MVNQRAIVLLGDFSDNRRVIDPVARQFEWRIESVPDLGRMIEVCRCSSVKAVFVNTRDERFHVKQVRLAAAWYRVPLVACMGFRDTLPDRELEACYHSLRLPIHPGEFRQCLGFLSQAERSHPAASPLRPNIVRDLAPTAAFPLHAHR
ncbi:MAG TPA: hypothetical protein VFB63_22635 [Bryobacteraceae bacterium]|nr:hypothetical protein [Bryobacteraceae bacterium]